MLSHELRDPLGAVVTATALLRGAQCPEEKRPRLLAIVERQSQQMARLLDDLLEASRVTQNKIELRKTRVDLVAVTRDAAEAVRNVMDARKMDFSLDLESEPLWVDGDTARLRQIQVNLLNNAAKHTHVGGRLRLTARRSGSHAVVVVIDDGAGIPESMPENVFDLFVQSKRTLDRSDGGLGVGLTLVRTLVAMHGGTVTARSKGAGYGSEFTVSLPLATVLTEEEPAVSSHHLRVGAPRRSAGKRVAVVEDNDDARQMLCEMLSLAGFECKTAERGDEGLELIRHMRPDIALVDLGLPGIDGLEIARRVRRDPALVDVCLVALTGYGQASDRLTAMNAGFDEHVVKPVRADELVRLLKRDEALGARSDADNRKRMAS